MVNVKNKDEFQYSEHNVKVSVPYSAADARAPNNDVGKLYWNAVSLFIGKFYWHCHSLSIQLIRSTLIMKYMTTKTDP